MGNRSSDVQTVGLGDIIGQNSMSKQPSAAETFSKNN